MKTKTYISRILWYQAIGFLLIIALSWVDEYFNLSGYFGFTQVFFNWREAFLENIIVLIVAIPLMLLTRRLLSHLYYLEGFLRVCAWCKKLEVDDKWVPIEAFFKEHFKTESSHGICPECYEQAQQKIKKSKSRKNNPA